VMPWAFCVIQKKRFDAIKYRDGFWRVCLTKREKAVMAIDYRLESLDGLEDNLKALYSETDDGAFVLNVSGIPAPDNTGLKKALQAEREQRASYEKQAKDATQKLDDMKAKFDSVTQKNKAEAQDFEEMAKKRVSEVYESEWKPKFDKLEGELSTTTKTLTDKILQGELMRAITAENGKVGKLLPALLPQVGISETGEVFVKDENGEMKMKEYNPQTGEAAPFTLSDLVKTYKEDPDWHYDFINPASGTGVPAGAMRGTRASLKTLESQYADAKERGDTMTMVRLKEEAVRQGKNLGI